MAVICKKGNVETKVVVRMGTLLMRQEMMDDAVGHVGKGRWSQFGLDVRKEAARPI